MNLAMKAAKGKKYFALYQELTDNIDPNGKPLKIQWDSLLSDGNGKYLEATYSDGSKLILKDKEIYVN